MLSTKATNRKTWDIEALDKLVYEKYGEEYGNEFRNLSKSVAKKIQIADYHHLQAANLLEGDACLQAGGNEALVRWAQAILATEAHILAYAHSMHSCIELFSALVAKALHLSVKSYNIYKVASACVKHPNIKEVLTKIKKSDEFAYLCAFVNSQKHVEFIGTNYWIGLYEDANQSSYGLKIDSYNYYDKYNSKTHEHPKKYAYKFITDDFIYLVNILTECGMSLNYTMKGILDEKK